MGSLIKSIGIGIAATVGMVSTAYTAFDQLKSKKNKNNMFSEIALVGGTVLTTVKGIFSSGSSDDGKGKK